MGFQALFKFVKCWRAPDVVSVLWRSRLSVRVPGCQKLQMTA